MTNRSSSTMRSQALQSWAPSGLCKKVSARAIGFRVGGAAPGLGRMLPVHALDLIFARLDDEAQQVVGVGERAEVEEGDLLIAAGAGDEVVAGGEFTGRPVTSSGAPGFMGLEGPNQSSARLRGGAGAGGKFRRRKGRAWQARAAFGHLSSWEFDCVWRAAGDPVDQVCGCARSWARTRVIKASPWAGAFRSNVKNSRMYCNVA